MRDALDRLDRTLRGLRPGSAGFLLACAVPAVVVVAILGSRRLPTLVRLEASGASAEAAVMVQACARHPMLGLRLQVAGTTRDVDVRVRESQCVQARVGERVGVTYLPAEPAIIAVTTDVRGDLARELLLVCGLGLAAFAGTAGVLLLGRRV